MSKFKNVALIGRYNTKLSAIDEIRNFLNSQGCNVCTTDDEAMISNCDLIIVVGGDGTMIGVSRQFVKYQIPLIGINGGRLGFITDISLDEYLRKLPPMLNGEYSEDHRYLIESKVIRDQKIIYEASAINDVVVNRGSTSGMVELMVEIDDGYVANHRADGLILATPTGSTAYALSAGGPIIHPTNPSWVMAPIAPQGLSNRPIVIPDSSVVTITVSSGSAASANFDMQSLAELQREDQIVSKRSDNYARFLHPIGWSYYDTLRKKLHWNE